MFELKPIHKDSIPHALEMAERYRFLNEPREAESICRDILHADAENQDALVIMILALTDQFPMGVRVNVNHAQELLPRLKDEYKRLYYAGVICERWAKMQFEQGVPGYIAFEWFEQAMQSFEQAMAIRPPGNEDSVLRWNTCARIIKRHEEIRPRPEDRDHAADFHDEVPHR